MIGTALPFSNAMHRKLGGSILHTPIKDRLLVFPLPSFVDHHATQVNRPELYSCWVESVRCVPEVRNRIRDS